MGLLTIHIQELHVHTTDDARLGAIEAKLAHLISQGKIIMARGQEVLDMLTQIDDATNAVATQVGDLQQEIRDLIANGATSEEIEAALAKGDAIRTKLLSIASDPDDPVPTS